LLEIAKIEGLDRAWTWSPAAGCRGIDCEVRRRGVCWAEKISKRFNLDFKPHLIRENLDEPLRARKPAVITPVPRGDLFGQLLEDVKTVLNVIDSCSYIKKHVFAILTKLPRYALYFNPYPDNVWFGVTVNSQADVWRLEALRKIEARQKYCLFEPLYGPIDHDLSWLDLIVIGPQTQPLVQPKRECVESIVKNAGSARIFYKSKLDPNFISATPPNFS
jgi:protein gp37